MFAADVCDNAEAFTAAVCERLTVGLPGEQGQARDRLTTEGWGAKAAVFGAWVDGLKIG